MSLQEILQLPIQDRLHIAEQIWNSINPEEVTITNEQKKELDARIAADNAGQMPWFSMNEMKERLDTKK